MRDETVVALKAWRASKAVGLDESKFKLIVADIRKHSDADLWDAVIPKKPGRTKKPADPLLLSVKSTLSKYKATADVKVSKLVRYLLPHRATVPKSMPAALRLLRTEFSDDEIGTAASELMVKLLRESGTDVPL